MFWCFYTGGSPFLIKKPSSGKSSGNSSRNGGNSPRVFNYGALSYAGPSTTESEDNSKYFKLLKKFGTGYKFSKSGPNCCITLIGHQDPLFSFPYTKDNIRNACFLFMNENNYEELMAIVRGGSLFEDCSGIESPPSFKQFD
jgi:hypothetical protein